jgi:hypothetical protein
VQQDVIQFIKESNRKYFVSGFDFDGSVWIEFVHFEIWSQFPPMYSL